MIETHLNIFDCVVIGIMALSCLFAFFRGLVREILSLVGWLGATVVTAYYFKPVAEKLSEHFRDPHMAVAAAMCILFIGALICFSIINMFIFKTIKSGEGGGMLDNLLGFAFGAFRGAFIISLGFFMITMALPEDEYPAWIGQSITHTYAEKGAVVLAKIAPDYLREVSSLQKKAEQEMRANKNNDDRSDDSAGYSQRSTRQLDRLIESSEPAR